MVENNPRNLDKGHAIEKVGENPQEDLSAEDMQGNSPQGTREVPAPKPEEEQGKNTAGKNIGLETEEGEVSYESDYEGESNIILTPKKSGRGRKSKNEERDQEIYKDVLSGSQPTIR